MSSGEPPFQKEINAQELQDALGGRYQVLEVIGRGGMGVVFKARQEQLDRLVAIKVLIPPSDDSEGESDFDFGARFEQEARAMARLSHPHIVPIFDYGKTESGVHYLVMEYVDGKDLQEVVDSRRVTPESVLVWGRQICEALAYAHEQGMVHRDIKPGNIMVDRDGKVRVADFGLVKVLGSNALDTQKAFGSVGYVAPEVLANEGNVDARADIYSVGVLLYQMLTGQLPWGLWEAPSQRIPGLDARFDGIVEKALRSNPEERYPAIAALKDDLDEIAFSAPEGYAGAAPLSQKVLLWRLAAVFGGLFVASSVGSMFNIYFNEKQIGNLLEQAGGEEQRLAFQGFISRWNTTAYPIFSIIWAGIVFSLCQLPAQSEAAKRRVINLPWWGLAIGGLGWVLCIPGLLIPLRTLEVPASVWLLLPLSILVSAGIALSQGFLAVDLLAQRLLYPHFFGHREKPWNVPGAIVLSLRGRGLLWMLSSSVCPLLALLLLVVTSGGDVAFTTTVTGICIAFGVVGVWLFGRMIVQPVEEFRGAAAEIEKGNLNVRVESNRADEFGQLASEFNQMTAGLRAKKQLEAKASHAASGKLARELFQSSSECRRQEAAVMAVGFEVPHVENPDEVWLQRNIALCWVVDMVAERKGEVLLSGGFPFLVYFTDESAAMRAVQAARGLLKQFEDLRAKEGSLYEGIHVGLDWGSVDIAEVEKEPVLMGSTVEQAVHLQREATGLREGLLMTKSVVESLGGDLPVREVKTRGDGTRWSLDATER